GACAVFVIDPLEIRDDNTAAGVVIVLLALPVLFLLVRGARARERSFDLGGLLVVAFGVRLLAAYFRFEVAVAARGDDRQAGRLAESFRVLDFSVDIGREVPGTGSVRYLAGLVHVVTGSTFFATFLIFVVISFLGVYWFYRAFETGFPDGDRRRYAWLLLLWPTMVFWPSSLGKEALLVAAIGLASWGAARLVQHGRGGLVMLGAETLAAAMVRPHVALIIVVA